MPPVGFETTISAGDLDRAATETGIMHIIGVWKSRHIVYNLSFL
jgi:hypothetical protein